MEATRFTNTSVDEIGINDSSRYPPDEFLHEDDPSRQYQANSDISYYVIPHGSPDLTNTEGTHEQNVQDEQIITQSTKASTSSYLFAQDRWPRDQHIKLVNIIGDPGEGMLTRSMDAKLTAASTSECLFDDFLSKIEPKKISEALKHPGWVDVMQEELNKFYRNKVWTLVPLPYAPNGYSRTRKMSMDDKGISICQEQYTRNLLKKYDVSDSSSVKTPMVPSNNLGRDLTVLCARYQSNPKESHLIAVKRILRYLKEKAPQYLIKFSVMNGKKPLILDYKTFVESTGLDYAKDTYVSHPSPKAVKAELAKIIENPILLDRTPVLGGNYSSIEQVNSIQQLIAYCLLTRTKVDIGEIIYSDFITRLTNKSRQKYVSYPRFVSCALEVLLSSDYTQDESFGSPPTILMIPLPFTVKKKKGKSQTVTPTLPQSQGLEASGHFLKRGKISSGQTAHPQDTERQTQLVVKGIHSPLDEGTRTSKPLLKGKNPDPQES
ncbi:hypothetical protein Tco_0209017 [Tanacetum coccineum]